MLSVHDNRIQSYTVDGVARSITLNTISESGACVGVLFSGVDAYCFERDNLSSIVFSIESVPLQELLSKRSKQLADGEQWGWPGWWNTSAEARARHFEAEQLRAYEIRSSFGLVGWVIAKDLSIDYAG